MVVIRGASTECGASNPNRNRFDIASDSHRRRHWGVVSHLYGALLPAGIPRCGYPLGLGRLLNFDAYRKNANADSVLLGRVESLPNCGINAWFIRARQVLLAALKD